VTISRKTARLVLFPVIGTMQAYLRRSCWREEVITKYVGVRCARCKKFIVLSSHQVERPEQIGTDFDISSAPEIRCPHCGDVCAYSVVDVAHSTSPDGSNPQYPYPGKQKAL